MRLTPDSTDDEIIAEARRIHRDYGIPVVQVPIWNEIKPRYEDGALAADSIAGHKATVTFWESGRVTIDRGTW